jgi:hypothetical protein
MAPRTRVGTIVAAAACAVVAATVGVTLLQSRGQGTTAPGSVTKPRTGRPPLFLDFGIRDDPEATALAHAAALANGGKPRQAAAIFARYRSLPAEIGLAFSRWPDGGLDELKHLVATHPSSPQAQFHLGMAYYWSGRVADAARTWQQVAVHYPDSPESVEAENVLYPGMKSGLPLIVTPVGEPDAPTLAAQVAIVERAARKPDPTAKLRYGLALWQLWRRVAAERQFDAAARLAPADPVVQTAAAVGAFTKRAPARAFARLGPLTGRFPRAAVVRFHLGLLLLWTAQPKKGLAQLRLAIADEPRSVYAKDARVLLSALGKHGTK